MKAIVTGHSRGIGEEILKVLTGKGHEVIGLSRSTGYDIGDTDNILRVVSDEDPDIFINNAYTPLAQTRLLKEVYGLWKKKHKLLINVCSIAALIPKDHADYKMSYASDKREQKEFCDRINFNYSKVGFKDTKCMLVNLNFDYVDTSFESKHDKRLYPNLSTSDVAWVVYCAIQGFENNICFRDISFHSTKEPRLRNERN